MEHTKRPPKKDRNFSIPIDHQLEQRAAQKAGSIGALRRVMRALLYLWVNERYPDPPAYIIEQTSRRAAKTARRKS